MGSGALFAESHSGWRAKATMLLLMMMMIVFFALSNSVSAEIDNDLVFDDQGGSAARSVVKPSAEPQQPQQQSASKSQVHESVPAPAAPPPLAAVDDDAQAGGGTLVSDLLQRAKRGLLGWWTGKTHEPEHKPQDIEEPAEQSEHRIRRQVYEDNDYNNGNYEDNGNSDDLNGDDEDLDGSAVGSGVKPLNENKGRFYRITLTVHEPYVPEFGDRSSPQFIDLARNLSSGVEEIYSDMEGEQNAVVVRIQQTPEPIEVLVTLDLGTKHLSDGEDIENKLREHIAKYRRIGQLQVNMAGFTFRRFEAGLVTTPINKLCDHGEIACRSGECVSSSKRCDGNPDCRDGSDEHGCQVPSVPDATRDPLVIEPDLNESEPKEPDHSTEPPLDTCRADDIVRCPDGSKFICTVQFCDGNPDCPGGGDEIDCPNPDGKNECAVGELACDLNRCISESKRCDGVQDCNDGTDEHGCPPIKGCQRDEFQCKEKCIESYQRCDSVRDCEDGEDELNCVCDQTRQWQCDDGSCIDITLRCDGRRDCRDSGSDERNCPETACAEWEFQCKKSGRCIPSNNKCDKHYDCGNEDFSDELNCPCGENDFKCDNGFCISAVNRCDGFNQCQDGSDEIDCLTPSGTDDKGKNNGTGEGPPICHSDQFRCNDGRCLTLDQRCNGVADCADGADEWGCADCRSSEFRCVDQSRCISQSQRCDGQNDCPDGSDEDEAYCVQCQSDQFQCQDKTCIEGAYRCNGYHECADGSDEDNCGSVGSGCSDGEFQCEDGQCINEDFRCDQFRDCNDGSDEKDCPPVTCREGDFQCHNGSCINQQRRCDGRNDCGDNFDEENCQPTTCSPYEFKCLDGSCIDQRRHCDGQRDCPDYSDEDNCGCEPNEFTCRNKQCIPQNFRCDGLNDCSDKSDELDCFSTTPEPKTCLPGQFTCLDQSQCVDRSLLCDRKVDCRDGSDESNCPQDRNCLPREFACFDGNQCIPESSVCNGRADCRDKSDEANCSPSPGGLNLKTYPDGQIIKESREVVFQCRDEGPIRAKVHWLRENNLPLPPGSRDYDGRLEMPDILIEHSGTYICEAIGYYPSTPGSRAYVNLEVEKLEITTVRPQACSENQATCSNLECIDKSKVCDGNFDCSDGSDEMRCSPHGCEPNEFRCSNKKCVLKTWRCDSDNDCGDGSDEENCGTNSPDDPCRYNEFQCHSGNQCIPKSFHCDLEVDCIDRSDEIGCSPVHIQVPPPPLVTLDIGDSMIISCTAVGVPTPEVVWRLNWGHLPPKCTTQSVNGVGTLTCPDIQESDQGAYSCEAINTRGPVFAVPDTILEVRRPSTVCRPGYFNSQAYRPSDCISCFCFGVTTDCSSANLFTYQLPPPFDSRKLLGVKIPSSDTIEISSELPSSNPDIRALPRNAFQIFSTQRTVDDIYPYFAIPENYLGNQLKSYGGYLKYNVQFNGYGRSNDGPDVILSGNGYTLVHRVKEPPLTGQEKETTVRFFYGEWYKFTGARPGGDIPGTPSETLATREEIMMTLGNVDNIIIKTQYVNGPPLSTTLSNIRMDSAAIRNTGQGQASFVEECRCPPGYSGLSCESCAPGYARQSQGPWLGRCVPKAIESEPCEPGTYGDLSRNIPCRPCPCPLTTPSNQFGQTCYLDTDLQPTCNCPVGYIGRRCEQCDSGYSGNPLIPGDSCSEAKQCDPAGSFSSQPDPLTGQCRCKEYTTGSRCDQCKANSFHLSSENIDGCIDCFCMGITKQCTSSNLYRNQISTTFTRSTQDFKLVEPQQRKNPITEGLRVDSSSRELIFQDFSRRSPVVYYWLLPSQFLGDKVTSYGGYLNYTVRYVPTPGGQISRNNAPDVEIISANDISLMYFGREQIEADRPQTVSVPLLEQFWQRQDGQATNREHLLMALADLEAILVKATYTTNTREAALIQVTLDIAEERNTGQPRALAVEQCACPVGYRGLSCEDCDVGYTRDNGGLYLGFCEPCSCNGFSEECDPETGDCFRCRDHTTGPQCNICERGYEGDPTNNVPCTPSGERPDDCSCDPRGSQVQDCPDGQNCICKTNVEGRSCDRCRRGTFDLSRSHIEGCLECYCSGVTDNCQPSNLYRTQIPMQIINENHGFTLTDSSRNTVIKEPFIVNVAENQLVFNIVGGYDNQRLFWSLPPAFTGNKIESYGGNITITQEYSTLPGGRESSDMDIIIIGNGISIYWSGVGSTQPDYKFTYSVQLKEGIWQRLLTSGPGPASRQDILNVLSSVEAILVRAFFNTRTASTRISDISLDTAVEQRTGQSPVTDIEICRCPEGYKGRSCEICASGYYRDTTRGSGYCNKCPCNGNERSCSLTPDGRVTCLCLPGYAGRYCDNADSGTQRPPVTDTTPIYPTPTITVRVLEPSTQSIEPGRSVRYRCTARSIYGVAVDMAWSKEGGELPPERAVDDRRGTLTITNTDESDSGIYICTANDRYSIETARAELVVGGGSRPTSPFVDVEPSYKTVNVGDSVDFKCTATGVPSPQIRWIPENNRQFNAQAYYNDNILRIPSVKKSDEGQYFCQAYNSAGNSSKAVYLYVTEQSVPPEPTVQLTVDPAYYDGPEGSSVRLRCLSGGRDSRLTWSRQGSSLPSSAQILDSGRDGSILLIQSATERDSGIYICSAREPTSKQISVRVTISGYRAPPTVRIEPERQTVPQGSEGELRCIATGEPTPIIRWSKAGEDLPSNVYVAGSVLRILNAVVSDRGIYICTAESNSGKYQASASVEIERREAPRVELYPREQVTLVVGASTLLQCRVVDGTPPPTIKWSREDGRPMTSAVQELEGGVLRLTEVTQADEGSYSCLAYNPAGEARVTASIEVQSPPEITLLPSDSVTVRLGERIRLECRASGDPAPSVSFTRYGDTQSRTKTSETYNVAVIEIIRASKADEGTYSCYAKNAAGVVEERLYLTVDEGRGDIPLTPYYPEEPTKQPDQGVHTPREHENYWVPEGGRVEMKCNVSAGQNIFLDWVRVDGRPLPDGSYVRDGVLYIENVQKSDAGDYACQGFGQQGELRFSVIARVDVIAQLHITLKPERQFVSPGDDATIECAATGAQPIRIWWEAIGRRLPQSARANRGFLRFNNIAVTDTGRYICYASNNYGKVEAVAEVVVNDNRDYRPENTPRQIGSAGTSVQLECTSRDEGSTFGWFREDRQPLPQGSFMRAHTLIIPNVKLEDEGIYLCVTESPWGRSSNYINLAVEPCGSRSTFQCQTSGECVPDAVRCDGSKDCKDGSDETYCYWRGGRGVANVALNVEASKEEIRSGDTVDVRCSASGSVTNATYYWSKVGERMANNVQTGGYLLRITNVKPDNGGVYRCTADTNVGTFSEDYVLTIQDVPDMNGDAAAVETKKASYGSTVVIDCKTELESPVKYSWSKQGGQLSKNAEIRDATLIISDVSGRDAGTYVCTADNGNQRMDIPSVLVVTGIVPYFSQSPLSYMVLPTLPSAYLDFDVTISFKPEKYDGLILYNGEKPFDGDFISLGLKNGRVEFRFNVGSGPAVITAPDPISLNDWHTVRIHREKKIGNLYVDGKGPLRGETKGHFQGLDLKEGLFIGGVPSFTNISSHNGFSTGFVGCISQLILGTAPSVELVRDAIASVGISVCETCKSTPCHNNGVCQEAADSPLGYVCICSPGFSGPHCDKFGQSCYPEACGRGRCINSDDEGFQCFCPFGSSGRHCEKQVDVKVPAFHGNSYAAYVTPTRAISKLHLALRIKPTSTDDGIIAYSGQHADGRGDFVSLAVRNRSVEFRFDTGAGVRTIRSNRIIVPGEWLLIVAKRDFKNVSLLVDSDIATRSEQSGRSANKGLNLFTALYIGGVDNEKMKISPHVGVYKGFKGCVEKLDVQGQTIDILNALIDVSNIEDCNGFGNEGGCRGDTTPCQNGGRCIEISGTGRYTCQCQEGFSGINCEVRSSATTNGPCRQRPCLNGGTCESETSVSYRCHCPLGWGGNICQQVTDFYTEAAFQGDGWLELPRQLLPHSESNVPENVTVEITTSEPNGLIFWQGKTPEAPGRVLDFISLAVVDGYLQFSFELGDGPAIITSANRVDDGRRHKIVMKREGPEGSLEVDEEEPISGESGGMRATLNTNGNIYIGGVPNIDSMTNGKLQTGFSGCIHALYFQQMSEPLDLRRNAIDGKNVKSCSSDIKDIDNELSFKK